MKSKINITEVEIQKAIQKFQMEGGLIRQLPDEAVLRFHIVGRRHGMYESFFDDNFGLEDGYTMY